MKIELMIGVVENNQSPLKNGTVQVRIFGMHSFHGGFEEVKTEHLPWIHVMGDFVSGGVGAQKVPEIGTYVYVLVPENLDMMLVLGTAKSSLDFNSISKGVGETILEPITHGENSETIIEPSELDSKTEYPHSSTLKTKSGHLIIQDDTKDNERIKIQHKSGQFFEIRPDGNFVVRSNSKETNYTIIEGSLEQYVKDYVKEVFDNNVQRYIYGNLEEYVKGQVQQTFDDSVTQTVEKQVRQTFNDSVNQKIAKVFSIDQEGNIEIKSQQSIKIEASGSCDIKGSVINLN